MDKSKVMCVFICEEISAKRSTRRKGSQNHRITEQQNGWSWKGPLEVIGLPKTMSRHLLNRAKEGDSATSLGNLCQGSVILRMVKCFLMESPMFQFMPIASWKWREILYTQCMIHKENSYARCKCCLLNLCYITSCLFSMFVMTVDLQTHYDFPYIFFSFLNWQ